MTRQRSSRRRFFGLVAAAMLSAAVAWPTSAMATDHRISGTLTDSAGHGVGGITVDLERESTGESTVIDHTATDGSGFWGFNDAEQVDYVVEFNPPGQQHDPDFADAFFSGAAAFGNAQTISNSGSDSTGNDDTLGFVPGSLSGTVRDRSTKAQLGGIAVKLLDDTATHGVVATTTTTTRGTYSFTQNPGAYIVEFAPDGEHGYVTQYYDGASAPEAAKPETITGGATTANVDAALAAVPKSTSTTTSTSTSTGISAPKHGKPKASKAKLSGLSTGKVRLKFSLTAGANGAPKLTSFTVKLPKGLAFVKRGLKKGVKLTGGGKFSEKLSKGALAVKLKHTAHKLSLSLGSKAIKVSRSLRKAAEKHKLKSLTVKVTSVDAAKHKTTTKLVFKKPR